MPEQEAFQVRAGAGLPVVAAAFVEVCGEVGQDVQAGHLRGGGDGPDAGGEACGVLVAGAVGVFLVTTGRRGARFATIWMTPRQVTIDDRSTLPQGCPTAGEDR